MRATSLLLVLCAGLLAPGPVVGGNPFFRRRAKRSGGTSLQADPAPAPGPESTDAYEGVSKSQLNKWRKEMRATLQAVVMDGNVMITTVTWAYLDFFENWRCSLEMQHPPLDVKYVVFANDIQTFDYLKKKNLPLVLNPALLASADGVEGAAGGEEMAWGSSAYQNLMGERTKFLLTVLEEGYNVLTFDADAVWDRSPLSYLDQNYDMVVVQEHPYSKLTSDGVWGLEICGCFLYLVNTPVTRSLLTETVRLFYKPRFSYNEQKVLGYLMQYRFGTPWEAVQIRFLPKPEFPNGREYYGYKWENAEAYTEAEKERVVVLHNNWVQGHSTKRQRWVEDGHWYLKPVGADGESLHQYTCQHTSRSLGTS